MTVHIMYWDVVTFDTMYDIVAVATKGLKGCDSGRHPWQGCDSAHHVRRGCAGGGKGGRKGNVIKGYDITSCVCVCVCVER